MFVTDSCKPEVGTTKKYECWTFVKDIVLPCSDYILRVNVAPDLNNSLLSIDLFRPMIIKKQRKNCECCPGHYLSTSVY